MLDCQACRFLDNQAGPPFGERPGGQGGQGVRHLVDQSAGEAEVTAALVGRGPFTPWGEI